MRAGTIAVYLVGEDKPHIHRVVHYDVTKIRLLCTLTYGDHLIGYPISKVAYYEYTRYSRDAVMDKLRKERS